MKNTKRMEPKIVFRNKLCRELGVGIPENLKGQNRSENIKLLG